jgi:hypothetical protein
LMNRREPGKLSFSKTKKGKWYWTASWPFS